MMLKSLSNGHRRLLSLARSSNAYSSKLICSRFFHCSLPLLGEKEDGASKEGTLHDLVNKYDEENASPEWLLSKSQPEWLRKRNPDGFEEINFVKNLKDKTDMMSNYSDSESDDESFLQGGGRGGYGADGESHYVLPDIAKMFQADMYPGEYHDAHSVDVQNPERGRGVIETVSDEWRTVDTEEMEWIPDEWLDTYLNKGIGFYRMSKRWCKHLPNPRLPEPNANIGAWPKEVVENRREVRYNPLAHCPADLGKCYEMKEEEFVNLVPEGYAGDLWEEFKFTKRRRMLIRKPALKAIELLRKLKDGSLKNPYESSIIFDGVAGSGKSACLNHVVHYARKAGILTLFIPNSKDWMMNGLAWYPSLIYDGMYEQPDFAKQLLTSFVQAHQEVLTKIPQRGKYTGKYVGNPHDPDLVRAHKEREEFVLGQLESIENKMTEANNVKKKLFVVKEENLEDALADLDQRALELESDEDFDYEEEKSQIIYNFELKEKRITSEFQEMDMLKGLDTIDEEVIGNKQNELEEKLAAKLFKEWNPIGDEGSLLHMIEWGLAAPAQAVQTVAHLREELAQVTEVPVLIAIDGVNMLYRMSEYFDDEERLPASKLLLPQIFQEFGMKGMREADSLHMKNGIVMATMENKHYHTREKYSRKHKRSGPIDPFHNRDRERSMVMDVPDYSDKETEVALMNYFDTQSIRFHVNRAVVQQVRVANDANPRKIFRYISSGLIASEIGKQ